MELLTQQGFRLDGRRPHELRKIRCKLGVFTQSDGSAYLEQGNTKVLCAVYGPHEVRKNRSKMQGDKAIVNCQYSMATFSTGERKFRPRGDRRSQEFTQHLQKCFETAIETKLYPRSQIDIYCEILQSDGGNLAACVNAGTLALIDAGVPMRDYVTAVTAGWGADTALLDVNYVEESGAGGSGAQLTLALLPRTGDIVLLEQTSRIHASNLEKLLGQATKGCKDVYDLLDIAVRAHLTQQAGSLDWQ